MEKTAKRKRTALAWAAAAVAIVAVALFVFWTPKIDLDADEVARITIVYAPFDPGDNIRVVDDEETIARYVRRLNALRLWWRGVELAPTGGGFASYMIEKKDGGSIEIANAGNVHVLVDGRRYRGAYEPLDELDLLTLETFGIIESFPQAWPRYEKMLAEEAAEGERAEASASRGA